MHQNMKHNLWTTKLFNDYLAAPLNSLLTAIGQPAENPAHPWENWITMEILVVLIIMVAVRVLRRGCRRKARASCSSLFETIYDFVAGQAHDAVEHGSANIVPFFGTLFIFILFMNLIGVIPGFESPTMTPAVPLALAVSVFLYYNWRDSGRRASASTWRTSRDRCRSLAPLMVPIEIISHLARPLSLTIRLYANMFAGEKVTMTFLIAYLSRDSGRSSWACIFSSHSYRRSFSCCSP